MKLHKLLLTIFALISLDANAQSIEKLVLKDGSVLEGHIVSQVPGKEIYFEAESTTAVLSGNRVDINSTTEEEIDNLSENWKQWANEHKEYIYVKSGINFIKMSNISLNKYSSITDEKNTKPTDLLLQYLESGRVKIIERGSTVTYVDINKRNYNIDYKNVSEIQKIPRNRELISGIVDVIETKDGITYKGQILTQKIGEYTKMLCDDNNEIVLFPSKDIKSQKKQTLNYKMTLFEQSRYLDIICSKGKKDCQGIIVNQTVSSEKTGNYILVQINENDQERIQISDITLMRKELNPSYKTPLTDIIVENDSIYLNRKAAKKITAKTSLSDENTMYVDVEKDSTSFKINLSELENGRVVLECYNTIDNANMVLIPVETKKVKTENKTNKNYYAFTYKILSESKIKPEIKEDISPNNTLRTEYSLEKGVYVLYRQFDKMCVLFEIKE